MSGIPEPEDIATILAASPEPTPAGIPNLTDVEADAFMAAIHAPGFDMVTAVTALRDEYRTREHEAHIEVSRGGGEYALARDNAFEEIADNLDTLVRRSQGLSPRWGWVV